MSKKAGIKTVLIFFIVASLIVLATGSIIFSIKSEDKLTGSSIRINTRNTIRVPDSDQPVPNTDEGTIVLWTKPPVEIFDQFSDARDYIIFYSSTNIPGLRIVYDIKESKFEAGTPLISSPKIDIFDGQDHQFVYTFKKGVEQAIYLDGVKVASSEFRPAEILKVTGMAFAVASIKEVDISGAEVYMYGHCIDQDDLAEI